MRPLSSVAAVCLFSSLLAAQTTTSFHSAGGGAFAVTNVNGTAIQIDVNRGDTSALLLTFTSTQNPDGSVTTTTGSGTIPNADFFSSTLEHMSLNVDTSQVPGFQSTTCTSSFTPFFTETCGPGPLGVIQVNWVNNRIIIISGVQEQHRTFFGVTVDLHIDASADSANASGSFLGLSFSSANNAFVQTNRDTTITITQ